MDPIFVVVAFSVTLCAAYLSLGWGYLALLTVGYFSGVVRANYLSIYTTFMFDTALLGLYLGFALKKNRRADESRLWRTKAFVLFLIAWPSFLSILPVNNLLVQFVALRATIYFVPVLLIATRLTAADLAVITRGLAVLNLLALLMGLYVYQNGVESLYPRNSITQIIYISKDIAGSNYHRIPSTFLSAHSYGGTMLLTLPFLFDRLAGVGVTMKDRGLALAGIVAAIGGLLMCGARSPLIILAFALTVSWILTRFSLKLGFVGAVLIGGGWIVAGTSDRLQRVNSLGDSDVISNRIASSANSSFFDLVMSYPLGAGMGCGVGTSIPYFVTDAPQQIGFENEYSRILVDQGWLGLGGWLSFVAWLCIRPPKARPPAPWRLGLVFMYSFTLASWMTAFIGTGLLSSVPGSVLLMTQMGVLAAVREGMLGITSSQVEVSTGVYR